MNEDSKWFHNAIIYEIYPDSFTDDGIKGVTKKLTYIKQLGADAVLAVPYF